jgi:serine O-acetyltransferase
MTKPPTNGKFVRTNRNHCRVNNKGQGANSISAPKLAAIVGELCDLSNADCEPVRKGAGREILPSRDVITDIIEDLRSVLFPGYFGVSEVSVENIKFHVGSTLDHVIRALNEQIRRGLCFTCEGDTPDLCSFCDEKSVTMAHTFLERLPEVQRLLAADVTAAYNGDPAATSTDETIFCYPGILAITNYRLAHELHLLEVPIIPRMIAEQAHSITGIDIHPGATIEGGLFIDHGTGVVIGETSEIGKNVRIYQGVTLGAKSMPLDENGNPIKGNLRHPVVEDEVVIYSGATILGRVTIGKRSVIGGNVWLTRSVSADSRITQAQVRQDRFDNGGGI